MGNTEDFKVGDKVVITRCLGSYWRGLEGEILRIERDDFGKKIAEIETSKGCCRFFLNKLDKIGPKRTGFGTFLEKHNL